MNTGNNKISSFFRDVNKRILNINGNSYNKIQLTLAGKVIEIRYWDENEVSFLKLSFLGRLISKEMYTIPNAIFWCYTDDVNLYIPVPFRDKPLPKGEVTALYQGKDSSGVIKILRNSEMLGADFITKHYYVCRHIETEYDDGTMGHPLIRSLYFWAEQENLLILHSAAVGINNKGILISARGGAGKSTLSISWLLKGLNFVSDDYVIINADCDLNAYPMYTMVGLNEDMYQTLRPNMPVISTIEKRNNKRFLDASSYSFCESLPIKAIVFPSVTEDDEPSISSTEKGPVLVKLVHSSVNQIGGGKDTLLIKKIIDRLNHLPVYKLCLTKDLNKNVLFLKNFMEGL